MYLVRFRNIWIVLFWIAALTTMQGQRSLVLLSGKGTPMRVFVNDSLINAKGLTEVRVVGLTTDYYKIKVDFGPQWTLYVEDTLYMPPQSEIVYEAFPPKRHYENGKFDIADVYPSDKQLFYNQTSFLYDLKTGKSSRQVGNNDMLVGCVKPITSEQLNKITKKIAAQNFDDAKLQTAKNLLKQNNCITVNQLIQILRLFNFDKNKVIFAQFAYPYVYDKEHFDKLKNVFDFESDYIKLKKYIRNNY